MPKINIIYCRDCPNYEVIKHLDCEVGDDVEAYCKETQIKFITINRDEWIPDWCPYKKREEIEDTITFVLMILMPIILTLISIILAEVRLI